MLDTKEFKISDAIEQVWSGDVEFVHGEYQVWDGRGTGLKLLAACAVGAACYAKDPSVYVESLEDAVALLPQLDNIISYDSDDDPERLSDLIFYLNDELPFGQEGIVAQIRKLGY